MSRLARQEDANQRSEAGMFYPTGYIVAGFANADVARKAREGLLAAGFGDRDVEHVPAAKMEAEAAKNLENPSLFASLGSSMPTRQKQLELAREGCDFVLIHAPDEDAEAHAIKALSGVPTRYAVKYKRLIIENLLQDLPSETADSHASRVA